MALASSSLVTVRSIKEVSFGLIPGAGNPKVKRVTGETLDYTISKESSKEINSDRTIASVVPVTASTAGNLTGELSYTDWDDELESTLQSTWVALGTDGETTAVTVDCTATTITAAVAPTGADAFTNLKPGQWFRVKSAGANGGKILRVHAVTAPTTTVITLDAATPASVSTGESVQLQSSRLTHGTTQTSFTIERENADIGVFMAYAGQTPSKLNVNVSSGALTQVTFDFMGKAAQESNTSLLPGSPVPASAYDVHSGVSGATLAVWMDGAPLTGTYIKSVSLDFDNSLRSQEAIGTLGAVAIASGTIACTATAQIYFANKDMFTKFRQNVNTSLIFSSTDNDGNGYIFTLPVLNITSYKSNASAKDQDQMLDITFTALADRGNAVAALRKVLFIDRVGNPV